VGVQVGAASQAGFGPDGAVLFVRPDLHPLDRSMFFGHGAPWSLPTNRAWAPINGPLLFRVHFCSVQGPEDKLQLAPPLDVRTLRIG
jgi:hypothetical protein